MTDQDEDPRRTIHAYRIRQVTDYQVSWTQRNSGEEGVFTLQLILDKGVEERILAVEADDIDVLLTLFGRSGHVMFDLERTVLVFENFEAD